MSSGVVTRYSAKQKNNFFYVYSYCLIGWRNTGQFIRSALFLQHRFSNCLTYIRINLHGRSLNSTMRVD